MKLASAQGERERTEGVGDRGMDASEKKGPQGPDGAKLPGSCLCGRLHLAPVSSPCLDTYGSAQMTSPAKPSGAALHCTLTGDSGGVLNMSFSAQRFLHPRPV